MTNANDSCLFFINYWIYWRKRTTKTLQIEMHEISCEINVHCCILWVSSKILKIKNLKLIKLDVFVLIYRCFFLIFFGSERVSIRRHARISLLVLVPPLRHHSCAGCHNSIPIQLVYLVSNNQTYTKLLSDNWIVNYV